MKVERILETILYADDLEAVELFYTNILGLKIQAKVPGSHIFFRCGPQMLLFFDPERSAKAGRAIPSHGARGPGHLAFAARKEDMDSWRQWLAEHGIPIEQAADWSGGCGHSIYFRDPAGNSLELITPSSWGMAQTDVFGVTGLGHDSD